MRSRPFPSRHWALLIALALAGSARAEAPPLAPASAQVHDHVAFTFHVADGAELPAQRASEAARNLAAVIDEGITGNVSVVVRDDAASVQVGGRELFRLTAADARVEGTASVEALAPRVQAQLDGFLARERRRASLQRTVLKLSLVVFFAVLAYLGVGFASRRSRAWEERLEGGDDPFMRRLVKLGLTGEENTRGALLLAVLSARLVAQAGTVYLFLIGSLSLFRATRPWRDALNARLAAPFLAMADRVGHGLPDLLLLLILFALVRAGWRVMSVGFERVAQGKVRVSRIGPERVPPFRLLGRIALVLCALLVVAPLLQGSDSGLFPRLGLLLLGSIALALIPLGAAATVGVRAMLRGELHRGDWLSAKRPGGADLEGEVTGVDFFEVRLRTRAGDEVRLPHLLRLWLPVVHRGGDAGVAVEIPISRALLAPSLALQRLTHAVARVASAHQLAAVPEIVLTQITAGAAHFRVILPAAPEALRTPLLLAICEAIERPAEGSAAAGAVPGP